MPMFNTWGPLRKSLHRVATTFESLNPNYALIALGVVHSASSIAVDPAEAEENDCQENYGHDDETDESWNRDIAVVVC